VANCFVSPKQYAQWALDSANQLSEEVICQHGFDKNSQNAKDIRLIILGSFVPMLDTRTAQKRLRKAGL
jgi:hypothetical protein